MDKKEIKTEELINQMEADYQYYSQELKTLRDIIRNKEKRNAALFLTSDRYRKALEEIEEIAKDGLNPICYKSNCSRCKCYNGDDCKAGMLSLPISKKILDIINKVKEQL